MEIAEVMLDQAQEFYIKRRNHTACAPLPYGDGKPEYVEILKKLTKKDIASIYFVSVYRIAMVFNPVKIDGKDISLNLDVLMENGNCKSFQLSETLYDSE